MFFLVIQAKREVSIWVYTEKEGGGKGDGGEVKREKSHRGEEREGKRNRNREAEGNGGRERSTESGGRGVRGPWRRVAYSCKFRLRSASQSNQSGAFKCVVRFFFVCVCFCIEPFFLPVDIHPAHPESVPILRSCVLLRGAIVNRTKYSE